MLSEVAVIVCHCHRVSDRKLLEVLRDGARTSEEIGRACGAGTGCGGCRKAIDEIVDKALPCECGASDCPAQNELRVA